MGWLKKACIRMLAFERFERCIDSVILGRCVTYRGCVLLALLSDGLYGSVCIHIYKRFSCLVVSGR